MLRFISRCLIVFLFDLRRQASRMVDMKWTVRQKCVQTKFISSCRRFESVTSWTWCEHFTQFFKVDVDFKQHILVCREPESGLNFQYIFELLCINKLCNWIFGVLPSSSAVRFLFLCRRSGNVAVENILLLYARAPVSDQVRTRRDRPPHYACALWHRVLAERSRHSSSLPGNRPIN